MDEQAAVEALKKYEEVFALSWYLGQFCLWVENSLEHGASACGQPVFLTNATHRYWVRKGWMRPYVKPGKNNYRGCVTPLGERMRTTAYATLGIPVEEEDENQ